MRLLISFAIALAAARILRRAARRIDFGALVVPLMSAGGTAAVHTTNCRVQALDRLAPALRAGDVQRTCCSHVITRRIVLHYG